MARTLDRTLDRTRPLTAILLGLAMAAPIMPPTMASASPPERNEPPAGDPTDVEYQELLQKFRQDEDFDLNYTFERKPEPVKDKDKGKGKRGKRSKAKKDAPEDDLDAPLEDYATPIYEDSGRSGRRGTQPLSGGAKRRLRTAGGLIMLVGMIGGSVTLGVGGAMALSARSKLDDRDDEALPTTDYLADQQQIVEQGKLGNTLMIAGGATTGGAFVLGLGLLLAGRDKGGSYSRLQIAPMFTRTVSGAQLQLRF